MPIRTRPRATARRARSQRRRACCLPRASAGNQPKVASRRARPLRSARALGACGLASVAAVRAVLRAYTFGWFYHCCERLRACVRTCLRPCALACSSSVKPVLRGFAKACVLAYELANTCA
eukprot:1121510-Pleurochrysis_carterae.AAC.1